MLHSTKTPLSEDLKRLIGLPVSAIDTPSLVVDLEAMRLTQRLHELGMVNEDDEAALIRTLGRSFARLAEWQLTLLGRTIDPGRLDSDGLAAVIAEITPVIEQVQNYVWRRHVLSAASRLRGMTSLGLASFVRTIAL